MLGTGAAVDELSQQRRQGAFGRIVGALIDVVLLVLAYWILGVPLAAALVRSTGYEWIGTRRVGAFCWQRSWPSWVWRCSRAVGRWTKPAARRGVLGPQHWACCACY